MAFRPATAIMGGMKIGIPALLTRGRARSVRVWRRRLGAPASGAGSSAPWVGDGTGLSVRAGLVALVLGLGLASPSLAQMTPAAGTIRGRVTYGPTGEVIPAVLVSIPELGLGKLTDEEGLFFFSDVVPARYSLVTSLWGCHLDSRIIEVSPSDSLAVALAIQPPTIDLQGLVVSGQMDTLRSSELPFAVGSLVPTDRDRSASGITDLLRGRFAGVRVVRGSGQPGDDVSLMMRGPTSIVGSQGPLLVVDGSVREGSASLVDPLDIARVEILRGAAAAARYGARGQAGVIEITTKRGPSRGGALTGPVILVDGQETGETLADIDTRDVDQISLVPGPAAAALYGRRAEAGIIHVTTLESGSAARPPWCTPAP